MGFVNLIVLRCTDIEHTGRFYECLGFKFERHKHGDGPEHLTGWDGWSIVLELYPASAKNPADKIGLGIGIGSMGKSAAALKERGFAPDEISDKDWGRTFVVRDPEGRRVEVLHQPSENDPDFQDELQRRIDEVESGEAETVPLEQVIKERVENRPPRTGPDERAS